MLYEELKEIVGEENLLKSPSSIHVYSYDASGLKGDPFLIITPESKEQIIQIINTCKKTNTKIVPRGAGTNLVGNTTPDNSLVIDLSKLNKIIEINTSEKYAVVEPGVVLNSLNSSLNTNLFFPVIPSSHKVCTIGGMIACNAVGTMGMKYGTTKDNILELEILDSDSVRTLKQQKEIQEISGSEGCFGIILSAKLKLEELPEKESLDHREFHDPESMMNYIASIQKQNITAIEFVCPISASHNNLSASYHLFIEYKDKTGSITDLNKIQDLWEMRDNISVKLASEGYTITTDPKLSQNKLLEFISWLKNKEIPSFGHIGIGIIHPRFKKEQQHLIHEMYQLVNQLGGNISGEHGIGILKKQYLKEEEKHRFKQLKQKYDPQNIFNPGKVI